jgi:ubiquitin-like 1-activating enzyme E1 B
VPRKSVFDTKAIAGNIVPAIATSNAVISGVLVQELTKVIDRKRKGEENLVVDCRTVSGYLQEIPTLRNKLAPVYVTVTEKPNPKCFVCSSNYIAVVLNTKSTTLNYFINEVLLKRLGLREPMVYLGSSLIYEHSEDDDDDDEFAATFKENLTKSLDILKIVNESLLSVTDNVMDVDWSVLIGHNAGLDTEEFEIKGDIAHVTETKAIEEEAAPTAGDEDDDMVMWTAEDRRKEEENRAKRGLKRKREEEEDDDDSNKRLKANDGKVALTAHVVEID